MGRGAADDPDRGRRPRRLRRGADGRLFDLDERRPVALEELIEDVRAGRPFRAYRRRTGAECTNEVLVQILRCVLPGLADMGGVSPLLELVAQVTTKGQTRPSRPRTWKEP